METIKLCGVPGCNKKLRKHNEAGICFLCRCNRVPLQRRYPVQFAKLKQQRAKTSGTHQSTRLNGETGGTHGNECKLNSKI